MKNGLKMVAVIGIFLGIYIPFAFAQKSPNLFAEILPPSSTITIPQPIQNLLNEAKNIQIDLNQLPGMKSAVESIKGVVEGPEDMLKNPGSFWERTNSWLRAKVGFDLKQVAKALGNLILWLIDLIKELVVWVVSKI